MDQKKTNSIRIVLYVVIAILTLILIGIIIDGIAEYNDGRNGYSYSKVDVSDLESHLEYNDYEWFLRDLKGSYKNTLIGDNASDFDEIRHIAEYYQWSIIAKSYDYVGDTKNASFYADRAAKCAADLGKYEEYREGMDIALTRIGN